MDPTREALERALAAEPDDLALHGAYADYLLEQSDPRGEYIRLELTLADAGLTPKQRWATALQARRLADAHAAEWYGEFVQARRKSLSFRARFGWVDAIRISDWSRGAADAFLADPAFRLLRSLTVQQQRRLPPNLPRRLADATCRDSLRALAFDRVALGDDGLRGVLECPLFDRLTALQLDHCDLTDDGARLLAADPRVPRLARLTLEGNLLSPIGIEALVAVGVAVAGRQRFVPGGDTRGVEL